MKNMTKRKTPNIWFLSVAMAVSAMVLSNIGMAIVYVNNEFNLSSGTLVSVQYVGFTVCVIAGGILADRFGKTLMLQISMAFFAVAAFLFAFGNAVAFAFCAVALIGSFGAVLENDITAVAVDCRDEDKDKNNQIVQIFFSVGAMIAPIAFYLFATYSSNYKLTYVLFGVFALFCFIYSLKYRDEKENQAVKIGQVFSEWKCFIKEPKYFIAPVAMFLYVAGEIGVWGFIPTYVENTIKADNSFLISALASSCIWASMFLGRFFVTAVTKRMSIVKTMFIFVFATLAGLFMVIFTEGYLVILAAALCGFGFAPFYPLIISWMKDITGSSSSSMIAATMAAGSLGPVVGGIINNKLMSAYSAKAIMYSPIICFVLIGIMLAVSSKTKVRNK